MNIEEVRNFCLSHAGVTEDFPFDAGTLVFKVKGKIFLLTDLETHPLSCTLKMDAALVPQFREKYPSVQPGYHMNKKYWNTVIFEGGNIPEAELTWMITHSYEQVLKGLPKKILNELNARYND